MGVPRDGGHIWLLFAIQIPCFCSSVAAHHSNMSLLLFVLIPTLNLTPNVILDCVLIHFTSITKMVHRLTMILGEPLMLKWHKAKVLKDIKVTSFLFALYYMLTKHQQGLSIKIFENAVPVPSSWIGQVRYE